MAGEFEQAFERAKRLAGDLQSADKSLNESSTESTNNKSNDSVSSTQSSGDPSVSERDTSGTPVPVATDTPAATATGASPRKEDRAEEESSAVLAVSLEKLAIDKADKSAAEEKS